VTAATLYVFRCLINEDIPLNSGVLAPVKVVLPECLLNPPEHSDPARCAAIVGGNVETSQRVVDVLLGALGVAAASQGTMNNLTFGDDTFGYYETICGGSGATRDADGADAVHTHMTNTRLTDPEVIERRYPVRVHEFSIRRGSGGRARLGNRDKTIEKEIVFEGIEQAILAAARKYFGEGVPLTIQIDRDTGSPTLFREGRAIDTEMLGEILGNISAQTAKHVMIQKIRKADLQGGGEPRQLHLGHRGGDGVIRRLEFLRPLRVSILSERRGQFPPFGINGGAAGALGQNTLQRV